MGIDAVSIDCQCLGAVTTHASHAPGAGLHVLRVIEEVIPSARVVVLLERLGHQRHGLVLGTVHEVPRVVAHRDQQLAIARARESQLLALPRRDP